MCPHPKFWNLIGNLPYHLLTFAQESSIQPKISFCVIAQHWNKSHLFPKMEIPAFRKQNKIINYSEPTAKLKLLGLLQLDYYFPHEISPPRHMSMRPEVIQIMSLILVCQKCLKDTSEATEGN